MDTGHGTFSLTRVILILTHFLNPLVKVIRNIYTGSYFMRFIRDRPHVLYKLAFNEIVKKGFNVPSPNSRPLSSLRPL